MVTISTTPPGFSVTAEMASVLYQFYFGQPKILHLRYLDDVPVDADGGVPNYQFMVGNGFHNGDRHWQSYSFHVFFGPEGDYDVTASEDSTSGLHFYGSDGANKITGTKFHDVLIGRGGNDILYGYGGKDSLWGGDGNDKLYGGTGRSNLLVGGAGNDLLYSGSGTDALYGGAGDDELYGGAGFDILNAGDGNDKIYGGDGDDYIWGDFAFMADTYDTDLYNNGLWVEFVGSGSATAYEDEKGGDDELYGGNGDDRLVGWGGNDKLFGEDGDDYLWGGDGNDNLYGGDGSDGFIYDPTDSVIDGGAGNDTIFLRKGTYTISGTIDNLRIIKDGTETNESQIITGIETLTGNSRYTYTIKMEKPIEGLTLSANLIDTNPAILISEPEAVFENPRKGDVIYTVEASDPDVGDGSDDFEYTLIGDTDFAIDKDGGSITYIGDPLIADSTHTLTVQSTEVDSGATATHTIQITLLSTEMVLDFSGESRDNIFAYQNERLEFNGDNNTIAQIHGDHGWDPEMQHTQNDTIIINGENNEIDGVYGNQGNDVLVFNGTGNKINSIGGGGGDDKIHINTHIFKHGDNKYVYMHGGEGHDQLHFKKASHWALGSNDNNWVTDNRGDYADIKHTGFENPDEVFYFRHEDVEYILTGFEEITVGGNPIYEIA